MMTFILAFVILLIVVAGMSIGVWVANKPITGSCGGMNALGMETECDVCGGNQDKCDKEGASKNAETNDAFYDVGLKNK